MSNLVIRTEPGLAWKYRAKVYKSYLWGAIIIRTATAMGFGNTAEEAILDAKNKYVQCVPSGEYYRSVKWDGRL